MKIALCDDEKMQLELLKEKIKYWGSVRKIEAELDCYENGEALIQNWKAAVNESQYDLILLDIQMHGMDGMSLARQIREKDERTGILFVTGYEEYMAQGYEVEAFRYLVKPVKEEKLWEALDQFVRRQQKARPQLLVETAEGSLRVEAYEVRFAESFAHTCELHLEEECVCVRAGISELEEQAKRLGVPFVRCHRSYCINIAWVGSIERDAAVLTDGKRVPVSRRMYRAVNQAFIGYWRNHVDNR